MALTTEQEAKVAKIIEAFENARRVSDLPEASGINPFKLISEVMDGGESKQIILPELLPYYEDECSYGISYDTTIADPACTRIGNMELHKTLPIQSRMRGCLLDDNGQVVEYLDPLDWTKHVLDGSRGQVMVEIPAHYRRFVTNGTVREARISEFYIPGYHLVPKMYVSAYEAAIQRSTGKLCSVVNTSTDYRGGNNTADWDNTYRSLLGRPVTNLSRTAFRNAARLRNNSATSEWNCYVYMVHKAIYWLYTIEYANRNCQLDFNAELTSEGYRQGGLGVGVVTMPDWGNYNGYNPIVPCGITNKLGNQTGAVVYSCFKSDGSAVHATFAVPRYRGIENPFGHLWKWMDGINVRISADTANGGDGLSKVFICEDPSKFTDSGYNGYSLVGNEARTEGYVKQLIFGEGGEIMSLEVGGSSSTNFCDFHYANNPSSGESLRGVRFCCESNRGDAAGLLSYGTELAPSIVYVNMNSRLCFIPASAS